MYFSDIEAFGSASLYTMWCYVVHTVYRTGNRKQLGGKWWGMITVSLPADIVWSSSVRVAKSLTAMRSSASKILLKRETLQFPRNVGRDMLILSTNGKSFYSVWLRRDVWQGPLRFPCGGLHLASSITVLEICCRDLHRKQRKCKRLVEQLTTERTSRN